MKSDFQRGVRIGLSIYGIGIVLTVIVHLIFGWDYAHGPPISTIPSFLTMIVDGLMLLLTAFMTIAEKSQKAKGELIVHIGVGVIILIFVAWVRHMAIGYGRLSSPKGPTLSAGPTGRPLEETKALSFFLAGSIEIPILETIP